MLININIRNVEYTDTGESPTWKCLAPNSDIRMKRQSSPLNKYRKTDGINEEKEEDVPDDDSLSHLWEKELRRT